MKIINSDIFEDLYLPGFCQGGAAANTIHDQNVINVDFFFYILGPALKKTDDIEGEQHGASDYFVTLGEPLHNNTIGDSAYVVLPATMTFKVHGQKITQTGAIFTVALRKHAERWRVMAWAWAKGTSV